MPTYTYRCQDCEAPFERVLRITQCDIPQVCPECDSPNTAKTITSINFVLKGNGWPGKDISHRNEMMARRAIAGRKQEEIRRDASIHLSPNVGGERVDSWQEAKKLAASQGKDTSGYDAQIKKTEALKSRISSDT